MFKYVYRMNDVYVITDFEISGQKQVVLPYNLHDELNIWAAYIRWSHSSQTDRYSFLTQFTKMISTAKNNKINVVALYVDQAKSAYNIPANRRKAMVEMRDYILSKKNVTGMIMVDESRLTRNIEDFQFHILNPIRDAKSDFKVYSADTGEIWDENNLHTQVRLSLYHEESEKKSGYSTKYQELLLKEQKRPEAKCPYGYSLVDNELVENQYAPIVMLIFHLYSFGYSEKTIATFLNMADTPTSKGKLWSDSSVRYILNNQWYIGHLTWGRRTGYHDSKQQEVNEENGTLIVKDHHPPLIGQNLWNITQNIRNYKSSKDRMNSPYILKGLLKCKQCGLLMDTKNLTGGGSKKKNLVYRCSSCKQNINIESIHNSVLNNYTKHWSKGLLEYQERLRKQLRLWNKIIQDKLLVNAELLEQLKYKRQIFESDTEYEREILDAFEARIEDTENQATKLHLAQEKIKLSLEDNQSEILARFNEEIIHFSKEEQKSLLLLSIKDILVDLANSKPAITINYRLTPYIDLEEFIESPEKDS